MRIPGALTVLGTPIDLASADVPTYVLAGETDHIVPWQTRTVPRRFSVGPPGSS